MSGNKHPSWAPPWLFEGGQLNEEEFSRRFNGQVYGWLYGQIEMTNKTYMMDQFRTEDAMVRQLKAWNLRVPSRLEIAADRMVGTKEPPPLGNGTGQDAGRGPCMTSPPPHYPPRQQQSEEPEQLTMQRINSLGIQDPGHDLRMLSSPPPDSRRQHCEERQQSIRPRMSPLTIHNSKPDPHAVPHPTPSPYLGRQKGKESTQAISPGRDPPNVQSLQRDPRSFCPPQLGSPKSEQSERDLAQRLHAYLRMPSPPPRSAWQQSENVERDIHSGTTPAHGQQWTENPEFNLNVQPRQPEPRKQLPLRMRTSGGKYALKIHWTGAELARLQNEAEAGDTEANEAYVYCRKAQKQYRDRSQKTVDFDQRKKHPYRVGLKEDEMQALKLQARQGNQQAIKRVDYLKEYWHYKYTRSGKYRAGRTDSRAGNIASTQPAIPNSSREKRNKTSIQPPSQPRATAPQPDPSQAQPANRFQSPPAARTAVSFSPTAKNPGSGSRGGGSKSPFASRSPDTNGKNGKTEGKKSGFLGGMFGGKKR